MVSSDVVLAVVIIFLVAALFLISFFSGFFRPPLPVTRPRSAPSPSPAGPIFFPQQPIAGLDPSTLDTFPRFDYSSLKSFNILNPPLDCYICLNDFHDHETLRLIPTCDHVFHATCIDTWLAFNRTCPVCRANLDQVVVEILDEPLESAGPPRSRSTGRVEIVERFTLRLPEEVRRKIISGKLRRASSWVPTTERGGSYGEETRWGRWMSTISPRLVSRSRSMQDSSPAGTAPSGTGGTME